MGRKTLKTLLLAAVCAVMAAGLSGCMLFEPVDRLYALPILPQEYRDLQTSIESTMNELGAEYATINYGSNTSTVQLLDLDGNGDQESAAVFLRVSSAEEKTMRVCLFRRASDNSYQRTHILEGDGTSINSVVYEDLTGDGNRELIVSWQMSAGIHNLVAYSLSVTDNNELLSTIYNENFLTVDLDGDGDREILIIQQDSSGEGNNRAEYYDYRDGIMVMAATAPLSAGMRDVVSVEAGRLADGSPGVYVTLEVDDGVVTDVLTLEKTGLVNVTRDPDSGVSLSTARAYSEVTATDINKDGVMEIPMPRALPPLDPTAENPTIYHLIYWRQFGRDGTPAVSSVTYHSISNGWYLSIPDNWAGNITVTRDDSLSSRGERAVIFYYWPDTEHGEPKAFLTIYRLTGSNREARARLSGRVTLYRDSSTVYCAVLDGSVWDCGLDESSLAKHFNIITAAWSTQ